MKTKERPIPFKAEMVRAILNSTKTQTRRIVKPYIYANCVDIIFDPKKENWVQRLEDGGGHTFDLTNINQRIKCRYGKPGDLLWVRETWSPWADAMTQFACQGFPGGDLPAVYRADFREGTKPDEVGGFSKWKSNSRMPRWASRITLKITDIRAERLQDITEEDAKAEGSDSKGSFSSLWESINGAGSWAANPYVWVIKFEKLEAE